MSSDQDKTPQPLSLAQLVELFSEQLKCSKARAAFVLRNLFRGLSEHLEYAKQRAKFGVHVCWVANIDSPGGRNDFYKVGIDRLIDYFTIWAMGGRREFIAVSTMLDGSDNESDAAIFFAPYELNHLFEFAELECPVKLTSVASKKSAYKAVERDASPLSAEQCAVMEARLAFIREIESLSGLLSQQRAILQVVDQAECGRLRPALAEQLACANDRHGQSRTLSERTIKRWLSAYRREGARGLVPVRREQDMHVPDWGSAFLEVYWRLERPSLKSAHEAFARSYSGDCPSVHQVRSFLNKLKARA